MLQQIPQLGNGPPILIATLRCLTPILVQVIGPETLYLAETVGALNQASDANVINAVQINKATGLITIWWIGDLYAAGSSPFQALITIPGVNTSSGLAGSSAAPAMSAVLQGAL